MESPATLQLSYTCTPADRSEAQSLDLRHQVGRGSKWLTLLILLVVLAVTGWFLWVRVIRSIPLPYRQYSIAAFVVLWIVLVIKQRAANRRQAAAPIQVELSSDGVRFLGNTARAAIPWPSFSKCLESETLFVLRDQNSPLLFILPKRAFPSPEWLNWFRAITDDAASRPASPDKDNVTRAHAAAMLDEREIVVRFQLGFRDVIDFNRASWSARGVAFGWMAMIVGVSIHQSFQPHPDAKFTSTEMFFYFTIPMAVVGAAIMFGLVTVHSWLNMHKHLIPMAVGMSDEELTVQSDRGAFSGPWTSYPKFKETRRSFLLWGRNGWLLLPKRAFTSEQSIHRCRGWCAKRLRYSTWFFGH